MSARFKRVSIAILFAATISISCAGAKAPDFTEGGQPDLSNQGKAKYTWTLGPIGARGWIYGEKLSTHMSRQIYVVSVDEGSPADGALKVGDVIIGLDGEEFDSDARAAFGKAITAAEEKANQGKLELLVWRQGKKGRVVVELPVLGKYGERAPFDCRKSQAIIDAGCAYIAAHPEKCLKPNLNGTVNALALLASGKDEYLPLVRRLAYRVGPSDLKLEITQGMATWDWGYKNLLLTEYHLATGDDAVLPAIEEYTKSIARGQSNVGTWGHKMASMENGILFGYGAVNQASLAAHISMLLADKCGVRDAVVKEAIDKSKSFFDFYVGKGSMPYGDHVSWMNYHSNNGANASAAIVFDLSDDDRGANFFARMTTASYAEREDGHTGNYFSYLWGPLGANRAGPAAVAAFLKPQHWYYDLARSWDGGFPYQGGAGKRDSYEGWDCTGVYVLSYALPLRNLYITGKGLDEKNCMAENELAAVIEAGRPDLAAGADVDRLLELVSNWSPIVRERAARELGKKRDREIMPALLDKLNNGTPIEQYGACAAFAKMGAEGAPAVENLIGKLQSKDLWLRISACNALAGIGAPARVAAEPMLRLALTNDPDDPREMMQRYLCFTLFNGSQGLLVGSLEGVDRSLLFAAWRKLSENEDGRARAALASIYDELGFEEIRPLWPAIYKTVKEKAPSGVMFAAGIRLSGLKWMADNGVAEGIPLCMELISIDAWGKAGRLPPALRYLSQYGAAAKSVLPALREIQNRRSNKRFHKAFEDAILKIESDPPPETMRSLGIPEGD